MDFLLTICLYEVYDLHPSATNYQRQTPDVLAPTYFVTQFLKTLVQVPLFTPSTISSSQSAQFHFTLFPFLLERLKSQLGMSQF
ncbi:hypothetical protein L2E82_44319 [Cichorium intybus]|uniref:Uncharacterized protein n=1 Tax=Cichorium intybus TaxID=13427 RepID=A0ACB8ZP61_CICIN|nr:hypothetical protein L2E82_44319 [Cichorium intybus]